MGQVDEYYSALKKGKQIRTDQVKTLIDRDIKEIESEWAKSGNKTIEETEDHDYLVKLKRRINELE